MNLFVKTNTNRDTQLQINIKERKGTTKKIEGRKLVIKTNEEIKKIMAT